MNRNNKNFLFLRNSRRLAVIDTRFPWKQSGFRYWENMQIYKQRPDTLFFATEMDNDDFPAKVYDFKFFRSIARNEGITDIYCVFLNLFLSLIGKCYLPNGTYMPGSNPALNIYRFIKRNNINIHTTLYPGGGLTPSTPVEFLHIVDHYSTTVFSNVSEVLTTIPKSIFQPVVINTDFYTYTPKTNSFPIEITFSAFRAERKGFPLLAAAFNELGDEFHLHIIGDWHNDLYLLKNKNYTFHGLLDPERIRNIYKKSHIFISPGTEDPFALDGFPTTAAVDAMSTGCLLISTNPRNDHSILEKDKHYLQIEANVNSIINTLLSVKNHFPQAMMIGKNGSIQVRNVFNSEKIVESKLSYIFQSTY